MQMTIDATGKTMLQEAVGKCFKEALKSPLVFFFYVFLTNLCNSELILQQIVFTRNVYLLEESEQVLLVLLTGICLKVFVGSDESSYYNVMYE